MKLIPSTLYRCCFPACSVFGGSQQSCKILDPDLAQGIYRGGCKDGWADGYGEVDSSQESSGSISSYRGDFLDGKKHGKGVKVMPNGDRYTGDFLDDYRDGRGVYVWGDKIAMGGRSLRGRISPRSAAVAGACTSGTAAIVMKAPGNNDLRMGPSVMEQRRAASGRGGRQVGESRCDGVCRREGDKVNTQRIRGIVESVKDKKVQVRIVAVEGGIAAIKDATLKTGGLLVDEVAHWQLCGPN